MRRTLSLLILLAVVGIPVVSHAAFFTTDKELVTVTDGALYRLRNNSTTFQLSDYQVGKIRETVQLGDRLFVVDEAADGQVGLLDTANGLEASEVNLPPSTDMTLRKAGDNLLIFSKESTSWQSYLVDQNQKITPLGLTTITDLSQIEGVGLVGNTTIFLQSGNGQLVVNSLVDNRWQKLGQLPCEAGSLINRPVTVFLCTDSGQVLTPVLPSNWQPIFPQPVIASAADQVIAASVAGPDPILYVTDGRILKTIGLDPALGDIERVRVLGSRVFLTAGFLYEVAWNSDHATITRVGSIGTNLITEKGGTGIYAIDGDQALYSPDSNSRWAQITTEPGADFSVASQVPGGHLIWATTGKNTQFASTGSANYRLVPATWSSSAEILDVTTYADSTYLLLLNSSQNPNLYKTINFDKWTLIHLPTSPTLVVSIAQARTLPPGSPVMTNGILTVKPGIVGSGVVYLQDDTGGIQIYLSVSKGSLPTIAGLWYEVDGTVSTSQTKRILLSEANDIISGEAGSIDPVAVTTDDVANYLGQLVTFSSTISSISKPDFSLAATGDLLKIHVLDLAQSFLVGDRVSFPAVIDYNSSSGRVEAWATNPVTITSRAPAVASNPALKSTAATTKVKATTKKSTATKSASKTSTSLTISKPSPASTAITKLLPTTTGSVPTTAGKQQSPTENPMVSIASLAAGLLISKGRRFRPIG